MRQSSEDEMQKITPLLKIVKNRQQLYLQLLNFITKNIQSSSNHHQQLGIFTKFLSIVKTQEKQVLGLEKDILSRFQPDERGIETCGDVSVVTNVTQNSKQKQNYFRQILRLSSRLIEILDASISKTRNSIFNQNGRLSMQFSRFKRLLHNILKGETVHLGEFTNHILNYMKIKYKKQLARIQKYVFKLQAGAIVALKELYLKQRTDQQQGEVIINRYVIKEQPQKQRQQQQRVEHGSESDSPKKLKKQFLGKSSKKGHKLYKSTRKQLSVHSDTKPPKQYTANKLLKFYCMMQLSKKQFLQDMVYERVEQEQQKRRLMTSLLQRNKTISVQISTYYKKSSLNYEEKLKQMNNFMSSGEEKQKQKEKPQQKRSPQHQSHAVLKITSLRKSFVISKRKSSLNFQKNTKILTQNDQLSKTDIFIKNIKNLPNRRKSSAQTTQRSLAAKSKKLFVIKTPVVFQDDNIPQAPTLNRGGQGWYRPPITTRKSEKKSENLRLKRRNNPLPISNSLFNDSFKFTQNNKC